MFKVFRIKEEHSSFLSDGGGIGSRGLASVRPHHASLFSLSTTVCLSLFPCSLVLSCSFPPCLLYLTLSLSFCLCFCWLAPSVYLSLTLSTSLRFLLSFFLSLCCISPHLASSHSSISSTPHCHLCSFLSSFFTTPFLPVPLSFPCFFHFPSRPIRRMAILISCSSFKVV